MPGEAWEFPAAISRGFTEHLGRAPSSEELRVFSRYLGLLLQWNRVHRLTGYRTPEAITEKLFLDSLLFLRWIERPDGRLLDLGAGAGIPGIPLKIVEPRLNVTLLEARRRRSSFLATAVRELGLAGVHVRLGRAEGLLDSEPAFQGAFDVVVTRAVAPPESIVPLALAFLAPGGRFIGSGPPEEKPLPPLPHAARCQWHSVPIKSGAGSRRFLIAQKV